MRHPREITEKELGSHHPFLCFLRYLDNLFGVCEKISPIVIGTKCFFKDPN